MKLTSPAFADKIPLPLQYTSKGENVSPPLEFIDVPKETVSLVLTVQDVDASPQRVHWLVYNIAPSVTHFDEGKTPEEAVCGVCHKDTVGYHGPSPETFKGIHRFCFRLYALDTMLQVSAGANCEIVLTEIKGHIIALAELVAVAQGEQVSESV
jgi:hypothetical protein